MSALLAHNSASILVGVSAHVPSAAQRPTSGTAFVKKSRAMRYCCASRGRAAVAPCCHGVSLFARRCASSAFHRLSHPGTSSAESVSPTQPRCPSQSASVPVGRSPLLSWTAARRTCPGLVAATLFTQCFHQERMVVVRASRPYSNNPGNTGGVESLGTSGVEGSFPGGSMSGSWSGWGSAPAGCCSGSSPGAAGPTQSLGCASPVKSTLGTWNISSSVRYRRLKSAWASAGSALNIHGVSVSHRPVRASILESQKSMAWSERLVFQAFLVR